MKTVLSGCDGCSTSRASEPDAETWVADFCNAGLTVEVAVVLDIRVQAVPKRRDQLAYFLAHGTETDVFTNLANGRSFRALSRVIERDLLVKDDGDGTLTVLILATGNAVVYGANGKAIARNPGQIRVELLIDHGGTPNDPNDDVVLSEEVVKGSNGRSDDFCAAVVPALKELGAGRRAARPARGLHHLRRMPARPACGE